MGGQRRVPLGPDLQVPVVELRRKHRGGLEPGQEALAAKAGMSLVSETHGVSGREAGARLREVAKAQRSVEELESWGGGSMARAQGAWRDVSKKIRLEFWAGWIEPVVLCGTYRTFPCRGGCGPRWAIVLLRWCEKPSQIC